MSRRHEEKPSAMETLLIAAFSEDMTQLTNADKLAFKPNQMIPLTRSLKTLPPTPPYKKLRKQVYRQSLMMVSLSL